MKENFEAVWLKKTSFALVATVVLGLCSAPLSAEELSPVGLDARGVDVRAVFRGDLDIRDALNRPVSRSLVERQLSGAVVAADRGAEVSSLPLAKILWRLLARVLWGAGLRGGSSTPPVPSATAWTGKAKSKDRIARAFSGPSRTIAAMGASIPKPFVLPHAEASCPLVLRC